MLQGIVGAMAMIGCVVAAFFAGRSYEHKQLEAAWGAVEAAFKQAAKIASGGKAGYGMVARWESEGEGK
jgi:hydroxyethylthiazole kinase-like sugar kinase family protein